MNPFASIALLLTFQLIGEAEWQPFLVACVVGAAVTLVVTALTAVSAIIVALNAQTP